MVAPISSIKPYIGTYDPEYMKILSELRKLGLASTGNKSSDIRILEQAKAELITKIKSNDFVNEKNSLRMQTVEPIDEVNDSKRAEMEEQRLGAMTVAELNRLYFQI